MSITIRTRDAQADGQFNGGAILEKRPIIPGRTTETAPYSNIFYWANAWTDEGSTIGEHPHRGFEIMSFVLSGQIEHYDSKHKDWKPLKAGDAQIIRSGSGISHAERMGEGSRMFQIWLDPNLDTTLTNPASYDDYPSASFPVTTNDVGISTKHYAGSQGIMDLETEGVEIQEVNFPAGDVSWQLNADKVYSVYFLEGDGALDSNDLNKDDFAVVEGTDAVTVSSEKGVRAFVIGSPKRPSYPTYVERFDVKFG
jgi:redox-sensitive bicupin YhaK (pirin superfamily)